MFKDALSYTVKGFSTPQTGFIIFILNARMLSRVQQLQFCSVCKNRKISSEQDVICGLTDKPADFTDSCEQFDMDLDLVRKNQLKRNEKRKKKLKSDFTFGLRRIGIKNGIIAGFIWLIIGTIWLVIGLNYRMIFWYPVLLIITGFLAIIIGIINAIRRSIENSYTEEPLEEEILDR